MKTISDLRGKLNPRKRPEPKPGTITRRVYDALKAGKAVRADDVGLPGKDLFNVVERLREGYDMQIDNLGYNQGYKLRDNNHSTNNSAVETRSAT